MTITLLDVASTAAIGITSNQWYSVKVSMATTTDADACSYTVWSNGAEIATRTFTKNDRDLRYLYFGASSLLDATDSGTIWFDLISIKTN